MELMELTQGMSPEHAEIITKAAESKGKCFGITERHGKQVDVSGTSPWMDAFDQVLESLGVGSIIGLCGGRGTGKTQLAIEAVKAVAMLGGYGSYDRLADFYMEIKATYRKGSDNDEADVIHRWRLPGLLVLDECHEQAATPWEKTMLNHLVDCRYGDMKDTILIANVKADEFRGMVGPSISSRMQESGGVIECDWESFRIRRD